MDEVLLTKANEGDLEAMLEVSRKYFYEENMMSEALEWARKTVEAYNNIAAYENLCALLQIQGYVSWKIGASDHAAKELEETLEIVDLLRDNEYYTDYIKKIESGAGLTYARIAREKGNEELERKLLSRVDKNIHPYAVVLNAALNSRNRNVQYMRQEFLELKEALLSERWTDEYEKGVAYYLTANHYLLGTGGEKNIDLAYEHMEMAARAGVEPAKESLKRFSKNFFGKIIYK